MTNAETVTAVAREAADSVFRYVERTAEAVEDGVRWQTMDYQSRPQRNPGLFNGVGGIPIFLAEYYRQTQDVRALELAVGGARWCSAPAQLRWMRPDRGWFTFGPGGVSWSWLALARATGDSLFLQEARRKLGLMPAPGTHKDLDFIGGVAGEGVLCLRAWEATGDEQYLQGAVQRAEHLEKHAVRSGSGCTWPYSLSESEWQGTGFAHGTAGVMYFLLLVHAATHDPRWRALTEDGLAWLEPFAVPDRGGLNWPTRPSSTNHLPCQWCWGAPGIGLLYAKAHEVLRDAAYLETSKAAGECTYQYGDVRRNPSECHGLAGNAELFVELYRLTRDAVWLRRAHDFGERCLTYRSSGPEGETWQGDEPGYPSPDFWCGASGTGHFFLRLLAPDDVPLPLH